MRALLLAIAVLTALPAFAGDAVDDALADLGADDAQKREAAEKFLWNAGPGALERAEKVLAAATDAEVRARLGPIVEWLALQAKCAPLEAVWKDRWFLMREDGEIVGVEHQRVVLEDDAGMATWKFVHESDALMGGAMPEHARLELRARNDVHLTPVDAELAVEGAEGLVRVRYAWKGAEIRVDVVENAARLRDYPRRSRPSRPLEREDEGPFTLDALVAERVERASLARIDRLSFGANVFMEDDGLRCPQYALKFAGNEQVDLGGRKVSARKYVQEPASGSPAASYWISDREGLVRAVIDRIELTKCDEATALAAGLDPASMRRKEARACVEALVQAEPGAARDDAELAVLRRADGLGPVREALKAATDEDLKLRLGRCANWLDPDFSRDNVARLWGEKYFEVLENGRSVGAERFGATPATAGGRPALSWSGEFAIGGAVAPAHAAWSGTTLFDPFLSPLAGEFKLVDEDGNVARWRVDLTTGHPAVQILAGTPPPPEDSWRVQFPEREGAPPTFDACLSALVERASLCRLPALRLQAWRLGGEASRRVRNFRVAFEGEEEMDVRGTLRKTRRYAAQDGSAERFWISDADGLVKMDYPGYSLVAMSRDAWLASGWDAASVERRALETRLVALRSPDPTTSGDALLALLSSPDSLPALRIALESEKDERCRARIESICRWLDPAFGRKELGGLGKTRWYAKRQNGLRCGWERMAASVDETGRWTFAVGAAGSAGQVATGDLDATFVCPDALLAGPYDAEIGMVSSGARIHLTASFSGTLVSFKRLLIDGEEYPAPTDSKPLSGPTRGAVVPKSLLPLLVERASRARLDSVEFSTWDLLGSSRLTTVRFDMKGEEAVTVGGKAVSARKYVSTADDENQQTLWITDDGGVVKGLVNGIEMEAATEEEAKKEDDK